MTKYLFLLTMAFLTACSPNQSKDVVSQSLADSASGIYLVSASPASPPEGDFGTLSTSTTITKVFTIKTRGRTGAVPVSLSGADASSYQLLTSTCNLSPVASCSVRVRFSSASKPNAVYQASVSIDDLAIPLVATVGYPVLDPNAASEITYTEGSTVTNSLSFGTVTTNSVSKVVVLKDINKKVSGDQAISLSGGFTSTTTSCTAVALNSSGCSVRILYSGAGKPAGNNTGELSVLGETLSLSVTVQSAPVVVGTPDVSPYDGATEITAPIVLGNGSISGLGTFSKTITFKNEGTGSSMGPVIANSSSDFYVTSNTCGSNLLAGRECSVKVNFSAAGKAIKNHTTQISYMSLVVDVSANVVTDNCGTGKVSVNGACQIQSCPVGQHNNPSTQVCEQNVISCVGEIPGSQSASKTWEQNSQAYGACVLNTCQSTHDKIGAECLVKCSVAQHRNPADNLCEDNVVSCVAEIPNSDEATKSWDSGSSSYGTCVATSCEDNYNLSPSGDACDAANFALNVTKDPGGIVMGGSLSCSSMDTSCSSSEPANSIVTLTYQPDEGYSFQGWQGDAAICGSSALCDITMTNDKNIGAYFSRDEYQINIDYDMTMGSINGQQGTYYYNDSVNLDAMPNPGYAFHKWEGDHCDQSTSSICSWTISNDNMNTVTAVFVNEQEDCTADIPNAVSAYRQWDSGTSSYGSCELQECDTSSHEDNGACVQNIVACSDEDGYYFGVQNGQKTWNPTTESYGYCYPNPNTSGSCKTGTYTYADGTEFGYVYRPGTNANNGSLFQTPTDSDNIYTDYNYSNGACVASRLSCTASIPNAKVAVRESFGGENRYTACEIYECNGGYSNTGSSCNPMRLFLYGVSTATPAGPEVYVYNPIADTMNIVADIRPGTSGFFGGSMFTTFGDSVLFSAFNGTGEPALYSYNTLTNTLTTEKDSMGDLQSPPDAVAGVVENNRFYNIFNTFTTGSELHYFNLAGASSGSQTLVVDYSSGTGSGMNANSPIVSVSGGWVLAFRVSNATTGSEILWT